MIDLRNARIEARLAYKQALVDWCLSSAERCRLHGSPAQALDWSHVAARLLVTGCDPLVSGRLESNLLEIAKSLPCPEYRPTPGEGRKRWLHVIERALPYGGHTAMASRWIACDASDNVHSAALTGQDGPVPDKLVTAVHKSGGELIMADQTASLLERARWLRGVAFERADYVVLHVASHSVLAPVAFGVNTGPPVLLVNHAAHLFWVGASVADLVVNCRGSRLEAFWTEHYRGIPRYAMLPIPIPAPDEHTGMPVSAERTSARRQLKLPDDAVVLISVGDDYKYNPVRGLNFEQVVRRILQLCPRAHLLLVGPTQVQRWAHLERAFAGRFRAVGRQREVAPFYAAADLYLESFPFGSTTALLEAGARGLACILAPAECPPPFATDGIAIDHCLKRPASVREFIDQAVLLIEDAGMRRRSGELIAESILRHHVSPGWNRYIPEIVKRVPAAHSVYPVAPAGTPPRQIARYWAGFAHTYEREPGLRTISTAVKAGLAPHIDWRLCRSCLRAGHFRILALLALCNAVLPLCSAARQISLVEELTELSRPDGKIRKLISSFARSADRARGLIWDPATPGGRTR